MKPAPTSSRARRQELSRQLDERMVELAYAGMSIDQPLIMALLEAWNGMAVAESLSKTSSSNGWAGGRCFARLHPGRVAGTDLCQSAPDRAVVTQRRLRSDRPAGLHLRGRVPVLLSFTAGSHEPRSAPATLLRIYGHDCLASVGGCCQSANPSRRAEANRLRCCFWRIYSHAPPCR